MRIREDVKLDYPDVLFEPKMSDLPSRLDVDLTRRFTFLNSQIFWEGVPIIAANMACTGTFAMAEALAKFKLTTALHKHYTLEDLVSFYEKEEAYRAWYTIGIRDEDLEKLATFKSIQTGCLKPELLCIDVANGYTKNFIAKCREIREKYPNSVIMAGNVCTPDLVQELLLNGGVDIVKVGIGPGSVCTTRIVTGVGYPQFSAVVECADAAHGLGGHICADGGCNSTGDIAKAFGGGADFVMIGGMLAGTDECDGEWKYQNGIMNGHDADGYPEYEIKKKSLKFFGMSSKVAAEKYWPNRGHRASEGKEVEVPYKGPVAKVAEEILGALQGSCSLIGADKLKDMSKRATFIKVNRTHNTIFS